MSGLSRSKRRYINGYINVDTYKRTAQASFSEYALLSKLYKTHPCYCSFHRPDSLSLKESESPNCQAPRNYRLGIRTSIQYYWSYSAEFVGLCNNRPHYNCDWFVCMPYATTVYTHLQNSQSKNSHKKILCFPREITVCKKKTSCGALQNYQYNTCYQNKIKPTSLI